MDKYTYFVVAEKCKKTGAYIAHALKVANAYNLFKYFTPFDGCEIISINACDTFKKAKEIADVWNNDWHKQGRYLFDRVYPA